jgi:NAD(P)-dependent dehydrogenase (short-subunit alcohol dehydrogenase family)
VKEFRDKVAVVTGGASGIGRAMAERFAAEGMKVVLADIERDALAAAEREMKSKGATVLAVPTDVAKGEDVEALAEKTVEAFGGVHVVCNNAGVAASGPCWERTIADWQWVLGVNLWGVIHGIRVFVPIMRAQDSEGHIVNTASHAGLTASPGVATYTASKHAVVALSEVLHQELALAGAKVKVSVLCPMWVSTRVADSDRNRPAELQNDPSQEVTRPEVATLEEMVRRRIAEGMSPNEVADHVFNAIRDERFYVITHPLTNRLVRTRMEDILEGRNPTFQAPV